MKLTFFEEIVATKGAIDSNFITLQNVQTCLDLHYSQNNLFGLLDSFLNQGFLSQSQFNFLQEWIKENKQNGKFPQEIDVNDKNEVEIFLGLKEKEHLSKTKTKMRIITCTNCQAKYSIKFESKSNKFRCAKCRSYFYTNEEFSDTTQQEPPASPKFKTVNLTKEELEFLKKHRPSIVTPQMIENSEKQSVNEQSQEELQSLWSSENQQSQEEPQRDRKSVV